MPHGPGRSDGQLPHYIQLDWRERRALTEVRLLLEHARDESYTPADVAVLAGDHAAALIVRARGGSVRAC